MSLLHRFRWTGLALLGALLAVPASGASAQNAVITGKVTSEAGEPLETANVYITELTISVPTNAQGTFSIVVPALRATGQAVTLRVRAVGYLPAALPIRVTAGSQSHDFSLKKDINRLSEVIVTGSIEGTERSKVAYSVGRVTAEDIPVPALNPVTALQGKVAGMRIASTTGRPGATPEIMLRGPTSLNATGRTTGPLMIVDGVILRSQNLTEIGGLDIESVEVVKGAAGAALYGSSAANGVIVIKTRRGASRDGVTWNFRTEYGNSVLNSTEWGQPINHPLQLDETGTRFCVVGSGNQAPCSKTFNWMDEILRINNVNADTNRTQQSAQWNAPSVAAGELLNVYQANPWPGQRYDTFKQLAQSAPVTLNSLEASGRAGTVRYLVSGAYTSDAGAIRNLHGQQQRKARVNLDYEARSDLTISLSTLYNKGATDNRGPSFGGILRGAPPGTNYLQRDTLGRPIVRGGGTGFRPTTNGAGTFLYAMENSTDYTNSTRYLANVSATYSPSEWASFDATYGYDFRESYSNDYQIKGYRTNAISPSVNSGNQAIANVNRESMNAQISATFRKQIGSDLNAKLNFRGLIDRDYRLSNNSGGDTYVVNEVYTLSNTTLNFLTRSSTQLVKNLGGIAGVNLDFKGRYIFDGTYRYDGSSLFGAGNRWAPFGRLSGVWRVSEESFWGVPHLSDFRLRVSRGSAGNTPGFTAQYETYSCSATGCSLGQAGNSQLKPETTTETELGTDFTLFGRLGVEFTYAKSDTRNQILSVPTPSALGFTTKWQNGGTLQNKTFEAAVNLPVVSGRNFQWNVRGTYDRNRAYITELFLPEYYTSAGTGQGTGSLFLYTSRTDKVDGQQVNRFGNIWGRKFYRTCSDMPASVQPQCGANKAYQVNDQGWVVWTGEGNSYKDGITKNLWNSNLSAADSPWNYPLQFGHPIIDRPLRGEKDEGVGINHILGNTLPDFRVALNNTITYKKLSLYALVDATIGHKINNQAEGWGLLDLSSDYFDQAGNSVETAKPLGYSYRVGGREGSGGTGGFYDILGPNNYNVESGSYAKFREVSLSYQLGGIRGVGDWNVSLIGRNLFTLTKYSGYDPETGVSSAGQAGSGLINQVDTGTFPTLRTYTISISSRFR